MELLILKIGFINKYPCLDLKEIEILIFNTCNRHELAMTGSKRNRCVDLLETGIHYKKTERD
jgi:hypothetical protein